MYQMYKMTIKDSMTTLLLCLCPFHSTNIT